MKTFRCYKHFSKIETAQLPEMKCLFLLIDEKGKTNVRQNENKVKTSLEYRDKMDSFRKGGFIAFCQALEKG